jgi:hypothetical protein
MKWIVTPLLWILALIVGIMIAWRIWRGKPVILKGRWSPKFVRMVVFVLVMLGIGLEGQESNIKPRVDVQGTQQGDNLSDVFPSEITPHVIEFWSELGIWSKFSHPESSWFSFKQDMALAAHLFYKADSHMLFPRGLSKMPEKFRTFVMSDLDNWRGGSHYFPLHENKEVLEVLDEMEAKGYYDNWLNAYLWRRSEKPDIELYARFHRHARIVNALMKARSEVELWKPKPWISKSAPPQGNGEKMQLAEAKYQKDLEKILENAKKLYPSADVGTWEKDGAVLLTLGKNSESVTLIRGGKRKLIFPNETFRFGRLDLIETGKTPSELRNTHLGSFKLHENQLLNVFSLGSSISSEGSAKRRELIDRAVQGDEKSAEVIETILPLLYHDLNYQMDYVRGGKGAPRLRLILSLFDDYVQEHRMPTTVP